MRHDASGPAVRCCRHYPVRAQFIGARSVRTTAGASAPVEVGVGVDAPQLREGLYLDTEIVREPMVNVRLTKPLKLNLAFEVTFAIAGTAASDYHTKGLYTLQVKQRLWRRSGDGIQVFATYGAAGVWRQDRIYG